MVLAADDVADAHGDVIDHHYEVVQRRAVGAGDDEVASELRGVDADMATDQIVELDGPLPIRKRTTEARPSARCASRSSVVRLAQRPT